MDKVLFFVLAFCSVWCAKELVKAVVSFRAGRRFESKQWEGFLTMGSLSYIIMAIICGL